MIVEAAAAGDAVLTGRKAVTMIAAMEKKILSFSNGLMLLVQKPVTESLSRLFLRSHADFISSALMYNLYF